MPHRLCRECHRLVSDAARTCPHCGIAQPVAGDGSASRLRPYGSALLVGLALIWAGGLWFRYQLGQLRDLSAPERKAAQAVAASADSAKAAAAAQTWRDSVRYGGGPSVGAPPSDFTGSVPPSRWCLQPTGRAPGDFGVTGRSWTESSRSWLRQVLADSTSVGESWRRVLGGAPRLTPGDSVVQVTDEPTCRAVADSINRRILGWQAGPPPVVIFRVRDYLVAYPSNVQMGEFGMAVGMSMAHRIRGVATW
jgi:hypothetical protein